MKQAIFRTPGNRTGSNGKGLFGKSKQRKVNEGNGKDPADRPSSSL